MVNQQKPQEKLQKPGVAEWAWAGNLLANRLTECVHAYKHNEYVFMPEKEKQRKADLLIKALHKIHSLLDSAEDVPEIASTIQDEMIVTGFKDLFRDVLKMLPWVSTDMQKLLKSSWMKGFPGKVAKSLFYGDGEEEKGIGSGLPEDGRLPGVLAALLEREEIGETRRPRLLSDEPVRHDEENRWYEQNKGYLRRAGRVD